MDQIQWHDMRTTALEIHIFIADCRLMSASIRVLDDKLKFGQAMGHGSVAVRVSAFYWRTRQLL